MSQRSGIAGKGRTGLDWDKRLCDQSVLEVKYGLCRIPKRGITVLFYLVLIRVSSKCSLCETDTHDSCFINNHYSYIIITAVIF